MAEPTLTAGARHSARASGEQAGGVEVATAVACRRCLPQRLRRGWLRRQWLEVTIDFGAVACGCTSAEPNGQLFDVGATGGELTRCQSRMAAGGRATDASRTHEAGGDGSDDVATLRRQLAECEPTVAAYTAILAAATAKFYPGLQALTKIIASFNKQSHWLQSLCVYRAIPLLGRVPDTAIANAALGACVRARRSDIVLEVLDSMADHGLCPDLITFKCAILAAAAADDWQLCISLYYMLLQQGAVVHVEPTVFVAIAAATARAQLWYIAEAAFLCAYGHLPEFTALDQLLHRHPPHAQVPSLPLNHQNVVTAVMGRLAELWQHFRAVFEASTEDPLRSRLPFSYSELLASVHTAVLAAAEEEARPANLTAQPQVPLRFLSPSQSLSDGNCNKLHSSVVGVDESTIGVGAGGIVATMLDADSASRLCVQPNFPPAGGQAARPMHQHSPMLSTGTFVPQQARRGCVAQDPMMRWACNALMHAYTLASVPPVERATALVLVMARGGGAIKPDITTFNHLIWLLLRAGHMHDAFACLVLVLKAGLQPTLTTCQPIMEACMRLNRLEMVVRIANMLQRGNVHMDVSAINLLLQALISMGDTAGAQAHLQHHLSYGAGVLVNKQTIQMMMSAAYRANDTVGALHALHDLLGYLPPLDQRKLRGLLRLWFEVKDWRRATEAWERRFTIATEDRAVMELIESVMMAGNRVTCHADIVVMDVVNRLLLQIAWGG